MSKPSTVVLLDVHAIIHRAYHALPDFASTKGEPTGALYGVCTMLLKIASELSPDYVIACYDLPGKTHRHEVYEAYKGTRKKIDDALVAQIIRSRDIFSAFNIPMYSEAGFEADDLLGTIAEHIKKGDATVGDDKKVPIDATVIIASGDMDTLQLVDGKKVQVYTLRKGIKDTVLYDEEAVKERFGFAPVLLPDFKGLRGDPSDNIIGIKGIGEKTATTLIETFGSVEDMYAQLEKSDAPFKEVGVTPRVIELLRAGKDEALFSKTLATIRRDAPIHFSLPEQAWKESLALDGKHMEALKLLFNQINIPYSFAAQDAAEMIKVDLKGSGRQVLETLLKSAKTPLTYRAENNTLIIEKRKGVSKEEEKANAPALLQLDFASAKAVAAELGKMTAFKGIDVQPLEQDNALTVTNASTRQLEILQDTVKLLDIQPISLIIKAELIVELKGEGDKKIQTVLATTGITFSGKEVTLDLSTQSNSSVVTGSGEVLQSKGTTLNQGVCRIVVMPRLNKDGLITLTSDGNIQLEIIVKGYVQPLKFERRFNSADRVRSGDTNTTLSSIVKVKGEKDTIDANIILVLTATRKPQLSKPPQNGGK